MLDNKLSTESVLSFLQATTNTFWNIENAIAQNESAHEKLIKARDDASVMIRSIREAFPDTMKKISIPMGSDPRPLEVDNA